MNPNQMWRHYAKGSHSTIIIYIRTGSITIDGTRVLPRCTAYLSSDGDVLSVQSDGGGADFLLMAGEPLGQEVEARGSMVMETAEEFEQAFDDYTNGKMGVPWGEKCTDMEWRDHLAKTGM